MVRISNLSKQKKAPARFELAISCLLDRRFNQLSHGAEVAKVVEIRLHVSDGVARVGPRNKLYFQYSGGDKSPRLEIGRNVNGKTELQSWPSG